MRRQILVLVSLLSLFTSFASSATASLILQGFTWKKNGRVLLTVGVDGQPVSFKGDLRNGSTVELKEGATNVLVKSYDNGASFITVMVTSDADDIGALFVLEGQFQSDVPLAFKELNTQPILGRKATMRVSLDAAFDGLKQMNGWDAALSIRKLIEYTGNNPSAKVEAFADQVELKNMNAVPMPKKIGQKIGNTETIETPAVPADAPRYTSENPMPSPVVAADEAQPANPQLDPQLDPQAPTVVEQKAKRLALRREKARQERERRRLEWERQQSQQDGSGAEDGGPNDPYYSTN